MILLEYHLKLHSIISENLPTYLEVLERNLVRIQELSEAQREFIRVYAAALPQQSFMCHGDFHPDNVIMKKDHIAVIDWSTAYRGNPLSDAVNMKILMSLPVVTKKMVFPINFVSRFFKPLIAHIYIRTYLKRTGATEEALDAWMLPSAVIRLGEGIPSGEDVLLNIINAQCKKHGFVPETENA
jgi:aminoglycoside phosphotransferase (APT) family kinase protein